LSVQQQEEKISKDITYISQHFFFFLKNIPFIVEMFINQM